MRPSQLKNIEDQEKFAWSFYPPKSVASPAMNVLPLLTKLAKWYFATNPILWGRKRDSRPQQCRRILRDLFFIHTWRTLIIRKYNKQQLLFTFYIFLHFLYIFLFYPHGGPSKQPPSSQRCLLTITNTLLRRILQLNHVDNENRASNPTSRQVRCSTKKI